MRLIPDLLLNYKRGYKERKLQIFSFKNVTMWFLDTVFFMGEDINRFNAKLAKRQKISFQ